MSGFKFRQVSSNTIEFLPAEVIGNYDIFIDSVFLIQVTPSIINILKTGLVNKINKFNPKAGPKLIEGIVFTFDGVTIIIEDTRMGALLTALQGL